MSNKSRIIRILTILIIFVILFMNVTNAQTMKQLRTKTENDNWFSDSSIISLPGSEITWAQDGEGFRADLRGSYCIDEPTSNNPSFTAPKTVNTVIDINNDEVENGEGKIIVYTKSGTYTYNVSDANQNDVNGEGKGIYEALRLANLARVATERDEQGVNIFNGGSSGSAKFAMAVMIGTNHVLNSLRTIHIAENMSTSGTYDYSYDNYGNYVGNALANTDLNNAAYEASSVISSIKDKTLNKENVKVEIINGKSYIGPYKVAYSGGSIGEITIVTEKETIKADAISYDKKESKKISDLENDKEFYIVAEKEISNTIKDITINVKGVKSSKARIVILDGKSGQDFIIYRGKSDDNSTELHLEVPKTGTLEIQKVDENKDSTISLKDIEFKVYAEKKGWVEQNGENITFNNEKNAFDKVKPFKTDSNGKISIKNLPTGYYWIYETGIPENLQGIYQLGETKVPGKDDYVKAKRVVMKKGKAENDTIVSLRFSVSAGQTATVTAVNSRAYTDVIVRKVDYDTQKPLNGYEFRLYRIDGNEQGWVRAENNVVLEKDTYTKNFEDTKIAKLNTTNGITQTLKNLPVGTYELYETGLGENGQVYNLGKFKKDNNEYDGKLIDTQEVKANATGVFTFEESNKQEFIKISGKVWEDMLQGKNIQTRDGKFSSGDKLIEGIEVVLFDRQTQQRVSTFTDANGEYTFEKVRIRASENSETADYLKYYVIMFKYDGIIYESTIGSEEEVQRYNDDGTINETSPKAFDHKNLRTQLNNLFKDITGEENPVLSNGVQLKYNKTEDRVVTLDNTSKRVETSNGVKLEGPTDFSMTAVTTGNILTDYFEKLTKNTQDVVTEIKHINFGVYERERPNLTLTKELDNAEVSVNGCTYTYKYNQKLISENSTDTTIGVDFDEDRSLPIYKADAKADEKDVGAGKELQATVTYKLKLQNASSILYAEIKEINEVFTDELEYSGEMYLSKNPIFGDDAKKIEGIYKDGKIIPSESIKLKPFSNEEGTEYLYIKFKIKDIKELYNIAEKNGGETPSGIQNKAEISKYSIYSDEFKTLYAGVDSTSIPNNHKTEHEDDDDKAPGLKIVDAGERTVSGTVFEDAVLQEKLNNNNERIGNGIFDDGEKTIKGVKVQLVDKQGHTVKVYDKSKNEDNLVDADATSTDENGNFTISGFLPGTYKLVYTWGDENGYKVEDYKGTIYLYPERADEKNVKNWYKDEDNRYSDAMDDYITRLAIDKTALGLDFDVYGNDPDIKSKIGAIYTKNKGTKVTTMESETPAFAIGIEKDEYTQAPEGHGFKFEVKNIDFGIIERPRQVMNIKKDLRGVLLTTNDSQQVVNAEIDKDGKLKVRTGEKYVSGGDGLPYIWVQVDKDITTGMIAKLKYAITVSNDSEKDYDDENYYKYGTIDESKAVKMKLKAENVYDICSGAALLAEDKVNTNTWTTVGKDEFKNSPKTMTENYFTENLITDEDGNITGGNWEESSVISKEILNEWMENITSTKTVRSVRIPQNAVIMKYASEDGKLLREMEPGESETAEIVTSKELSNGDNIRFDNDVEITNIKYSTNQKTGRKPSANTSRTYDRAEWTTITPATGEDRDYTWIIITAVSAIAVLGVGIIIIKKKVLK